MLLHTALKCFTLPYPLHVFSYAGQCLGGWTEPKYLHFYVYLSVIVGVNLLRYDIFFDLSVTCFSLCAFIVFSLLDYVIWKFLLIFKLFSTAVWGLFASTLLCHARACPLVAELVSFIADNSLIISVIIMLSFSIFINCSFKCLFLYICNPHSLFCAYPSIHLLFLLFVYLAYIIVKIGIFHGAVAL